MNKRLLLTIVGIGALLLIAISTYLILDASKQVPAEEVPGGVSFPGSTTIKEREDGTFTVPLQNGESVQTNGFINNGVTIEDPANEGVYYLAGTNGTCTDDGSCPSAGPATKYNIVYFSADNSFVIGITDEPLSEVRKQAEQRLQTLLGISTKEMCALKYSLSTPTYVNRTYGGINLGFSFCPGSTELP